MPMRNLLAWLGVAMAALFGWVMAGTADVADGRASVLPWWPVALFVGLALGLVAASRNNVAWRVRLQETSPEIVQDGERDTVEEAVSDRT